MLDAIAMPKLGMQMQSGTLLEWCVPLGAAVTRGQCIARIEFEKAEAELEAPASGVLRHVYTAAGETVPCGAFLGVLTRDLDEPFAAEAFRLAHEPPLARPPTSPLRATAGAATTPSARERASAITPAARRRARELGVEVAQIAGSGPGGRVTREDVESWAARGSSTAAIRFEPRDQGAGPLVLLLPGFGANAAAFARQVPALRARHRLRTVQAYDIADVPAAAFELAARLDEPAHVVGASLGAAVALELAVAAPERIRSLVLITPFLAAGPRLGAVLETWCRLAAQGDPELLGLALLPWLFGARTLQDANARQRALRGLVEISGSADLEALVRTAAALRTWRAPAALTLARIACPVLVAGGSDDVLTPGANDVAKIFPGARSLLVPGAGHALGAEAPDALNPAILDFLAENADQRTL